MKWRLMVLTYCIAFEWGWFEMKSFGMRDALDSGTLGEDRKVYRYGRIENAHIRHLII